MADILLQGNLPLASCSRRIESFSFRCFYQVVSETLRRVFLVNYYILADILIHHVAPTEYTYTIADMMWWGISRFPSFSLAGYLPSHLHFLPLRLSPFIPNKEGEGCYFCSCEYFFWFYPSHLMLKCSLIDKQNNILDIC